MLAPFNVRTGITFGLIALAACFVVASLGGPVSNEAATPVKSENLTKLMDSIATKQVPPVSLIFEAYKEYVNLYKIQSELAFDYGYIDENKDDWEKSDAEIKYDQISDILSSPMMGAITEKLFRKLQQQEDSEEMFDPSTIGREQLERLERSLRKAASKLIR